MAQLVVPKITSEGYKRMFESIPRVSMKIFSWWPENREIIPVKIKYYTDRKQSRKLSEILPKESADMWYHGHYSPWESERKYDDKPRPFHSASPNWDLPCWSLTVLLEILPPGKVLLHDNDGLGYKCICNNIDTDFYGNPVDACVAMVEKLHNFKM